MLAAGTAHPGNDGGAPAWATWIALTLSVVGIAIQTYIHYLDGGRVLVQLRSVLWERPDGGIMTRESGQWQFASDAFSGFTGRPAVTSAMELAEVVIENKGRHPVTVYEIGLSWKNRRLPGQVLRQWHHVAPRAFKIEGHGDSTYQDKRSFRIEPHDRVSVLFDYWTALPPGRESATGTRVIRASTRVAGNKRPTRSGAKTAWRIPDTAVSAIEGETKIALRKAIATAVARADPDFLLVTPHVVEEEVRTNLAGRPWPEDFGQKKTIVDEALNKHLGLGGPAAAMKRSQLTFAIIQYFDVHKEHIAW